MHPIPGGGEFLVAEAVPAQVFTPESLSAEAHLMAKTMEEFLLKEVLPCNARLEAQEPGLMRSLVQQAGQLGLLAGSVPERYGGLELPKTTLALLTTKAALNLSFAITIGVHAGVSLLPLLFFGTPEQKQQYLPGLASGEQIGAFALSEANSGSDALGAQTRAVLSPDGKHYLLNGTKLWTTNGGFADLFTVFAQVDGTAFTAFLVERDRPGVLPEREEHKLGLHGSSTRRILLQDARVPVENVLGEVGQGHRPALYALNIGRFNIAATALGAAQYCLQIGTRYALQRAQFGQPIAQFGLIQHKLAEMALRIFLLESMVYRIAGYWDGLAEQPEATVPEVEERLRTASEEYAIECALLKFFGTEVLDYVVDEALQIHGGFGYSEEFPIAQFYRDARVFRIFEGTNEINRLTVTDQLLRRMRQGRLPLLQTASALSQPSPERIESDADPMEAVGAVVRRIRAALLLTIEAGWNAPGEPLRQQEVAAAVADMTVVLFALESAWLRSRRIQEEARSTDVEAANAARACVQVYSIDACVLVEQSARRALAAFTSGETLQAHAERLQLLLNPPLWDTISLRHRIANAVTAREGYPW
jgi:alkylation response protein AidB-like acyl-CoA dehydrogenase